MRNSARYSTNHTRCYQKTDGAFDITVGPIVNALGFGSTDTLNVDSAMIDSLLHYVGMEKVTLQDGHVGQEDTLISYSM